DTYLKLLGHSADFHLSPRHSVVLKVFPSDPSQFREDVSPYVKKIIEKYGIEEWKACLLTNEFHRHLGIYSLIGAKMGIRAREILEAPFDTLRVVSFAGTGPPLSCMNDGLQVSTGASLGRGTIKISNGIPQPAATFLYKDQKLTLKIKRELVDRIKTAIKAALREYGGLNPSYFAHIRKLAIDYWYDLDRKKIFDEKL
ncbi:MAG: formylmethanofuran dehydrogenase subunit E family protein, partial [Desulfobacterales bacterium]|nr:formylmethanofuran dehydrogenase subunit E family protein [Desulfobacterales bacterium]